MRTSPNEAAPISQDETTLLTWRGVAALALSLALLDLAFGLLPFSAEGLQTLSWAPVAFAMTQVGALAAIAIALGDFVIVQLAPSERRFRASAAWAAFCLASFAGYLSALAFFTGGASAAATAIWLGGVAAGASFWLAGLGSPRQARALLFVTPWLAAALVAVQFLKRYGELGGWSVPAAAWVGACALLIAGLLAWSQLRPGNALLARAPLIALAAIVALGGSAPFRGGVRESPTPPGAVTSPAVGPIILLTIDTLRSDAVSFESGDTPTPRLAELAGDSVVFERAYSTAPWTKPAMASMLTGLSPPVHLLRAMNQGIPQQAPTLAELLAAAGYRTEAVGSNRLLSMFESDGSFARGFERYEMHPLQGARIPNLVGKPLAQAVLFDLMGFDANSEQLTDAAVRRLRENAPNAFLLWLHYYDPHSPYAPPPELLPAGVRLRSFTVHNADPAAFDEKARAAVKALYDSETRWVDEQVGRIVEELKHLGIYDDALLIVSSDHGEEFWDHGRLDHGHTLYDELLGATLIVKLPNSRRRGHVDRAVSTVRVTPTILDLAGVAYDPSAFSQRSLKPLIEGDGEEDLQPPFASALLTVPRREAVIVEGFKLICRNGCEQGEAYDLIADPGETIDVWDLESEASALARALLSGHRVESARLRERLGIGGPRSFELNDEEIERLRSLGYIQ